MPPIYSHHRAYTKSEIDKLVSVQRSFTKRLQGLQHVTYGNRLKILQLNSLETRRLKLDLLLAFLYKKAAVCLSLRLYIHLASPSAALEYYSSRAFFANTASQAKYSTKCSLLCCVRCAFCANVNNLLNDNLPNVSFIIVVAAGIVYHGAQSHVCLSMKPWPVYRRGHIGGKWDK